MSVAAGALASGRKWAESLMTDTARIQRRAGSSPVPDPVSGELVWSYTVIYEGKCRLVLRSSVVRDVDAASQLLGVQGPRLDVPVVGTGGVRNGDEFEVLSSASDSELVGLVGVVSGMFPQSYSTARRLPVEVHS